MLYKSTVDVDIDTVAPLEGGGRGKLPPPMGGRPKIM